MPNARCILPSRRRRRDIPRDGVCPAASGRQVMTSADDATATGAQNVKLNRASLWMAPRLSVVVVTLSVRRAGPVEEIVRFVGNQRRLIDGAARSCKGGPLWS